MKIKDYIFYFTFFDPLNVYIQFRFTKACLTYNTYTIPYGQIQMKS